MTRTHDEEVVKTGRILYDGRVPCPCRIVRTSERPRHIDDDEGTNKHWFRVDFTAAGDPTHWTSSTSIVCYHPDVAAPDVLTEILRLPAEERARLASSFSGSSTVSRRGRECGVGRRVRTPRCRNRCRNCRDANAR